MKTNNISQTDFRAGRGIIHKNAEMAMKKRMSLSKFEALKDRFEKKYADTDFEVELSTVSFEAIRLDAIIRYKNKFKRYVEETIMSSVFRGPEKFIGKINKIVEEEIMPKLAAK